MKNGLILAAFVVVGLLTAEAFAQNCGCGVGARAVSSARASVRNVVGTTVGVTKGVVCKDKGALCAVKNSAASRVRTNGCTANACTDCATVAQSITTITTVESCSCDCNEGVVAKATKCLKGALDCAKDRRCARRAARNSSCSASVVSTTCTSCVVSETPTSVPTVALPPQPSTAEATLADPSK